jgi:glyoxylase-like metal-dependent hydrolase (beta-lactamase superfamily II)
VRPHQTVAWAVALCIVAFFSPHSAAIAQGAPPYFGGAKTVKLGDGIYSFTKQNARNIFIVTDEGVIATDPISPDAAADYMAEIRKVTDKPVKYLVYSHQHWDHVRGGQIFKDAGATVLSHQACMTYFHRDPNPDVVLPDQTFEGPRFDLELGGKTLELYHFGRNHGDCLIVMRIPEINAIFLVDLVTPYGVSGGSGLINDFYPTDWIRSLKEIEAMEFDYMIGGHGPPKAPHWAVTERREYLEALMVAVKSEMDSGTTPGDIAGAIRLPKFQHLWNYDRLLARNAERIRAYYILGW